MTKQRIFTAIVILAAGVMPTTSLAQSAGSSQPSLKVELNALEDIGEACRLTFVAQNETGKDIDRAVFETVVFDASGGVKSLSLFDFRALPANRPRVRQFDLPGMACDGLGQILINGADTCDVDGDTSSVCRDALVLDSRLTVELLG